MEPNLTFIWLLIIGIAFCSLVLIVVVVILDSIAGAIRFIQDSIALRKRNNHRKKCGLPKLKKIE